MLIAAGALCSATSVTAYEDYQDEMPNGDKVLDGNGVAWPGVGHGRSGGGGSRNQFGKDFAAAGHKWTTDLCNKDSDGDGTPNGVELGDPQCKWEKGTTPQFDAFITHPGLSGDRASTKDTCKDYTAPASSYDLDVKFTDYNVPSVTTSYVKQAFTINRPTAGQDLLVTSVEAIVDNLDVTHHMLLYACKPTNTKVANYATPSPDGGMPCNEIIWAWAVGGKKFCFPDLINVPIQTEFSHFMLEIHYDNPTGSSSFVDSSGLRLTVVSRENAPAQMKDAGFIWNNAKISEISLPAGEDLVRVTAPCTLPGDPNGAMRNGVSVFAYMLHAHKASTKIFTTVTPFGKEPVLAGCEPRYDFDLQEFKPVDEPYSIFPGSTITTTCIYNTEDRTSVTRGGDETSNEMCIGIFLAFPKVPFSKCQAKVLEITTDKKSSDDVCTSTSLVGQVTNENGGSSGSNGSGETLTGAPQWVEAHGFMMTVAWMLLIPLAISFPVLFKNRTDSSVNWLLYHRAFVGVGLGMVLIAVILAIINTPSSHFASTHGKLGLVTVIVAFVQVVSGVLRPHKEEGIQSRARSVWEPVHWWTGRGVVVLAAAAVYTGYANNLSIYIDSARPVGFAMVGVTGAWGFAYVLYKLVLSPNTVNKVEKTDEVVTARAVAEEEGGAFY